MESCEYLSPIFQPRSFYKPFDYPWAFDLYKAQNKAHWLAEEVSMAADIQNWKKSLNISDKHLISQILRFFTQGDVDVADGYIDKYMPIFKKPELRNMLTSFANMESIHQDAYSTLLDDLGFGEKEYKAFLEYEEMVEKHDYLFDSYFDIPEYPKTEEEAKKYTRQVAKNIAIYSAFTEGVQLFSSFAILFNFGRQDVPMNGLAKIVEFSIKDENMHVEGLTHVFRTIVSENPWLKDEKGEFNDIIVEIAEKVIEMEDRFIDLAFELGDQERLTAEEVKKYIRYIADFRLEQLGFDPIYKVKNPLPWMMWITDGEDHQNFFEGRSASYSKANFSGKMSDIWA